jgi:transcriptional regulator with XRE-family HTH domain
MLPFEYCKTHVSRDQYLPSRNRGIEVSKRPETIGGHLRKRRLQLGLYQKEAARRLGVSTVALSRWECDKVYPAWAQQPAIIDYLGYNPFTNPALGSPHSNEASSVAFLSQDAPDDIGKMIMKKRIEMRKTRKGLAKELGISIKTISNLEMNRRMPRLKMLTRIQNALCLDH